MRRVMSSGRAGFICVLWRHADVAVQVDGLCDAYELIISLTGNKIAWELDL